jgi:hypothetical protein
VTRALFLVACLLLASPAYAAFPQVAGSCSGTDTVSDTTQVVGFDCAGAFGTISAGNLLLIAWQGSGTDATPTSSCPEFTQIDDQIGGGGNGHTFTAYKIAEGDEGTSMNCTSEQAETSSFIAYRITPWHGTTAPEGTGASFSASAALDPPSVTASWGSADNLWIVIGGTDTLADDITAFPANYTANQLNPTNNGAGDIASATREVTTDTEDPGTFTNGSTNGAATTVVVRPAASVAASGVGGMLLMGVGR